MGIPFYRDIEDGWVDKETEEVDPDFKPVDLVDPKAGCDFKIVKSKTGKNPWDISFEKSFALDERDSGSEANPITYTSSPGTKKKKISGGKRLDTTRFTGTPLASVFHTFLVYA